MKTARKGRRDSYLSIKSKLMAAVAMLLVASFMVVSSSYAWFTLSTAPEVTGIHTAVGANGNLEIALYRGSEPAASGVNDSGNFETWGNLIDLSDNDKYGLDKISLLPAELNLNATGNIADAAPLKTPVYGNDGRIKELSANSTMAVYDPVNKNFTNTGYGVQAIGTASGMTPQQIDYRTAQGTMNSSLSIITKNARSSLEKSGSQLGTAVVGHAAAGSSDANTYNISSVTNMIADLKTANAALENYIKAYFDAAFAKAAEQADALLYEATSINWETTTLASIFTDGLTISIGGTSYTVAAPGADTAIAKAYAKYTSISNAITAAETTLAKDVSGAFEADGTTPKGDGTPDIDVAAATWEQVRAVFVTSGLVNLESIKVNGFEATKDVLSDNAFFQSVLSDGITVQLGSGSGVYPDFAELTGNYTVAIVLEEITYGGMTLTDVNARMATVVTGAPTIVVANQLPGAPVAGSGASTTITDFYGYAIDLAFRTNAVDSHLMLQTEATNRIYSTGGSEDTMGHGSTMTFESAHASFTPLQMQELMKSIRVVFASNNVIVAVGVLTNFVPSGTEVTANINLVEFTTQPAGADSSKLVLTPAADGTSYEFKDDAELMALTQNQTEVLSVYVYLDGNTVENADVAANATMSMSGKLNLQFSSDANLIPMAYAPLQDASAAATTTSESVSETEPTTP